jgi:hypothetical protein
MSMKKSDTIGNRTRDLPVLKRTLRTDVENADLSVPCLKPNFEFFPTSKYNA